MKTQIFIFLTFLYACSNGTHDSNPSSLKTKTALLSKQPIFKKRSAVEFIYVNELHFRDKENNQQNIYSVYIKNYTESNKDIVADMLNEGKTKPHEDNGLTVLLFFNKKEDTPMLKQKDSWLVEGEKYSKSCVAGYFHYPKGSDEIKEYPLKVIED